VAWAGCAPDPADRDHAAEEAEELLRTLVATEIAARDEANRLRRHRAATFPVVKTFDAFDVTAASVPQATIDYLAGLEWVRAPENLCPVAIAVAL